MAVIRARGLLCCLLLGISGWAPLPSHSIPAHAKLSVAATQPNLVVRPIAAIGGQITSIAGSGTLIYLAQANGLTILNASDPQRIAHLSRSAVAPNEPTRNVQLTGASVPMLTWQANRTAFRFSTSAIRSVPRCALRCDSAQLTR